MRESSPRPRLNCQVLVFTLSLVISVLKELAIDRVLETISRQLTDIKGT
jgi:hypothetical protein